MLKPLRDYIAVRRIEAPEKLGHIVIPPSMRGQTRFGTVVAVGPGRVEGGSRVPMNVKPGDTLLLSIYSGTEVVVEDETLLFMKEAEALGVVDGLRVAAPENEDHVVTDEDLDPAAEDGTIEWGPQ